MNTTDYLESLDTLIALVKTAQKQVKDSKNCLVTLNRAETYAEAIKNNLTKVESERSALYHDVTHLIEAILAGETKDRSYLLNLYPKKDIQNILERLKKAHE